MTGRLPCSTAPIAGATNAVVAVVPVGDTPRAVLFDGTSIWVSNNTDGTLSKIDPTTDAVVETVSVGVYVGVGTRHEPQEANGVAHLLEHMAFKGTTSRSARLTARVSATRISAPRTRSEVLEGSASP